MSKDYFCASCWNFCHSCDCLAYHDQLEDQPIPVSTSEDSEKRKINDGDWYFMIPFKPAVEEVGLIGMKLLLETPQLWTQTPPLSLPTSHLLVIPKEDLHLLSAIGYKGGRYKHPTELDFITFDPPEKLQWKTIAEAATSCLRRRKTKVGAIACVLAKQAELAFYQFTDELPQKIWDMVAEIEADLYAELDLYTQEMWGEFNLKDLEFKVGAAASLAALVVAGSIDPTVYDLLNDTVEPGKHYYYIDKFISDDPGNSKFDDNAKAFIEKMEKCKKSLSFKECNVNDELNAPEIFSHIPSSRSAIYTGT